MKRLLCVLFAATLALVCAGCRREPIESDGPGSEPPGETVTADDSATPQGMRNVSWADGGGTASYASGAANMALDLPAGWLYALQEETQDGEGFGILIRPAQASGYAALLYYDSFAVCGTGLETRAIKMANGDTAYQCTRENEPAWEYVSFADAPGAYFALNRGLTGDDADQAIALLKTARLGVGILREAQAVEIAKSQYDGNYEEAFGVLDYRTGVWSVRFLNGGEIAQTLTVRADGAWPQEEETKQ